MTAGGMLVGGIVLLLALLAGLIWALGAQGQSQAGGQVPRHRGRMVDVGGYRLHLNCQGTPVAGRRPS